MRQYAHFFPDMSHLYQKDIGMYQTEETDNMYIYMQ